MPRAARGNFDVEITITGTPLPTKVTIAAMKMPSQGTPIWHKPTPVPETDFWQYELVDPITVTNGKATIPLIFVLRNGSHAGTWKFQVHDARATNENDPIPIAQAVRLWEIDAAGMQTGPVIPR